MKIGILFTVNEYTVDPASLARKMEALGFESLWIPEHAIIPVHTTIPRLLPTFLRGRSPNYSRTKTKPSTAAADSAQVRCSRYAESFVIVPASRVPDRAKPG